MDTPQTHTSHEVNNKQPRNYATSLKQRKWLERAHVHHPLLGRNSAQFGPLRGGCWVRPGLERVRKDLDGVKLVDAIEWQGTRQGRPWDSTEQSLIDELDVRTLNVTDLAKRRLDSRPIWLDDMVLDQFGDGAPEKAGFYRFIGDLVYARRAHAVGLRVSQTEAAALYKVSDRQWRRWMATAEDTGIVRLIQTWESDTTERSRHRRFGKMVYMLGPAIIERAGMALLEGLDVPLRDGRSSKRPAYQAGRKLRAARIRDVQATRNRLWLEKEARRKRSIPSLNCLDMTSATPPPKGRGIGGPGGPGARLNKAEVCATRTLSPALPPMPIGDPTPSGLLAGPAPVAESTKKTRRRGSVQVISNHDMATVYGEHSDAFKALWAKLGGALHVLAFFVLSTLATACDVQSATDSVFYFFTPRLDKSGAVDATHERDTKKCDGSHGTLGADERRPDSLHFRRRRRDSPGRDAYEARASVKVPGDRASNPGAPGGRRPHQRRRPKTRTGIGGARGSRYPWGSSSSSSASVVSALECRWRAAGARSRGIRVEVIKTYYLGPGCPASRSCRGRATRENNPRSSSFDGDVLVIGSNLLAVSPANQREPARHTGHLVESAGHDVAHRDSDSFTVLFEDLREERRVHLLL